jgi:hypothetical protein
MESRGLERLRRTHQCKMVASAFGSQTNYAIQSLLVLTQSRSELMSTGIPTFYCIRLSATEMKNPPFRSIDHYYVTRSSMLASQASSFI